MDMFSLHEYRESIVRMEKMDALYKMKGEPNSWLIPSL